MANTFTIPPSNSLRFVNTNKINDVQNYDNRFVKDLVYARTLPYYYIQQFQQSDPLWFQFRTNYTGFTVYLVDEDNNEVDQASNTTLVYTDSSGRNYYNVQLNLAVRLGCYFIKVVTNDTFKPLNTFMSEVFNVSETVDRSVWIEWFGNQWAYDDMMHWTDLKQGVRVIGSDRELMPDKNKTVYDNSDYVPATLKAKPLRKANLVIDLAPFWIIEKINIAFCHDDFYLQKVQYNTDEDITPVKLGDLLVEKATVILTQLDFENGEDEDLTGEIEDSFLKINDTDYLLINDSGDRLKLNN